MKGKNYCNRCLTVMNDNDIICTACGHTGTENSLKITESNFPSSFMWYGFVPAIILGFLSYLIIYMFFSGDTVMKQMGTALFFIVPASTGMCIGYFTRPVQNLLKRVLITFSIAFVLGGLIYLFDMSGVACVSILVLIFILPIYIGMLIGRVFRLWNSRRLSNNMYSTPLSIFFMLPVLFGGIEQHYFEITPVHVVTTEVEVNAPKEIVWKKLRFYEHVKQDPPFLLRLGLPIPKKAIGNHRNIGDVTSCEYEGGGFIKKRITNIIKNKELSFDVIEQSLHFEHDLTLKGGSIILTAKGDGSRTLITMKTSYESYVRPSWFWEYNMDAVIHSLHNFVITDIKQESQQPKVAFK